MQKIALAFFFSAALLLSFGHSFADCTSPAATGGTLKIFTPGNILKLCDGIVWRRTRNICPSGTACTTDAGSAGKCLSDNLTCAPSNACGVARGADCGGGSYVGDTNLVFAKSGCRPCGGNSQPTCAVAGDNYLCDGTQADTAETAFAMGPNDGVVYPAYGDGYTATETLKGTGRDAINFCANLVANGYSDWFVPTLAELEKTLKGTPSYCATYNRFQVNQNFGWMGDFSYINNFTWNTYQGGTYWTITPEASNACNGNNQCMISYATNFCSGMYDCNNNWWGSCSGNIMKESLRKDTVRQVRCARRN